MQVILPVYAQNYDFSAIDKIIDDSARAMAGISERSSTVFADKKAILYTRNTGRFNQDSIIPIASASKWLSGAVIMHLVDKGLISLDDSCGKYLPLFKGDKARITIRQLMSHTSGLPGNSNYESDRTLTLAQAVDSIAFKVNMVAQPGTEFRYGGVSMQVAGRIAEIVLKKPWDSIFTDVLAKPLGMKNTDYNGFGETANPMIAGGARSTAADYILFLQMLLNQGITSSGSRVLSATAINTLISDQTNNAAIISSPFDGYAPYDSSMAKSRYGIGNWIEMPGKQSSGARYDNSSQGAFGFSPWIDWNRGIAGIIAVRTLLQNTVPTYLKIKLTLRSIMDAGNASTDYLLTVQNGYGSARYKAGDTVHVFATFQNTVFGKWELPADIKPISMDKEWHISFIMPARDITIIAKKSNKALQALKQEQIKGVQRNKQVAWAFPDNMIGVVYLFHGTGGGVDGWLPGNTEKYQMVQDLLADSLGVIITESEESTLRQDLDGDGNIRWKVSAPVLDSSIDYQNLKAITDTMIQRGVLPASLPRYGVGMSNGGAFAIAASAALGYNAAISYCASGRTTQMYSITMPVLWCMARNDDNENVGEEGNEQAFSNYQILINRGIKAEYKMYNGAPIYSQRFLRAGTDSATSALIFTEIKNAGLLQQNGFLKYRADSILRTIIARKDVFPITNSQPARLQSRLNEQIRATDAAHEYYSDFNRTSIAFLKKYASRTVSVQQQEIMPEINIYPMPAQDYFAMKCSADQAQLYLHDLFGNKVLSQQEYIPGTKISTKNIPTGIYMLQIIMNNKKYQIPLLIQQ